MGGPQAHENFVESRGVSRLESMNLSNALSSLWVGHRPMGTHNPVNDGEFRSVDLRVLAKSALSFKLTDPVTIKMQQVFSARHPRPQTAAPPRILPPQTFNHLTFTGPLS